MQQFVKVAVNLATNKPIKTFTYSVPDDATVALGSLVVVPFRNSVIAGYVIGSESSPQIDKIKSIISVVDKLSLSEENRQLASWIADYYICSNWASTSLFLPPGNSLKIKKDLTLHIRKPRTVFNFNSPSFIYSEDYAKPKDLTPDQQKALSQITEAINASQSQTFLLNGITGSGKTEVYARAIEQALSHEKTAILLVPEIAMSIQVVARLSSRFAGKVAVLHSGLSAAERLSAWMQIKEGKVPIVIGARSAIFAPLDNIGLVIVDEEHEASYKQNRSPRYNGRDVAVKRAALAGAVCILGSATPSLESRYNCDTGLYKQLIMKTKPLGSKVAIDLIDMRELDEKSLLSSVLINAMKDTLSKNQKVLLLLNRRGFSSFLLCPSCGYVAQCERCSVSLTYHSTDKSLRCHHCDYRTQAPAACPTCGSSMFRFAGSGTQKLEQKISELFASEVVIRLDRDNSDSKNAGLALKQFAEAKRAILLGTQIIGKGLDFKEITLVGIINADTSLNFPDFRAGERTFQLLHQVAGRCGRGQEGGRVIIQSYNSEHYAILATKDDNYEQFYKQEIDFRKELDYPPYSKLINIGFSSLDYSKCKEASYKLSSQLSALSSQLTSFEILGPVEAPIRFLKNRFRWHILLKSKKAITGEIKEILANFEEKDVAVTIDIDPTSLL